MNITELKDKINSLDLLDQLPDIHGYSLALKEVNGVTTNDLCIQFHVKEKKSLEQLNSEQVLPTNLSAFGIEIITDVTQSNENYNLGTDVDFTISNLDYFNNPNIKTEVPISLNYYKNRPLLGGSSSIYIGGSDATLGLLVTDATDNSIVALSNSHVYAASQFIGTDALKGKYLNTLPLSSSQPGAKAHSPFASSTQAQDCIGIHKRCVALSNLSGNKVDCAIVQLSGYSLVQATSTQVNGFSFKGPYQFASTQEIDSLMDINSVNYNSPIFRSGRTLGPMGFPGNLYTKTHYYTSSAIPIKEIPISNINSVWFETTNFNSYKTPIFTLLIKTNNNEYWASNNNNNSVTGTNNNFGVTPTMNQFMYVGKFDYLTTTNLGSIGLSAGKLVYYGSVIDKKLWPSNHPYIPNDGSGFKVLPMQLDDYNDFKKIVPIHTGLNTINGALFLLKGDQLYVIGSNPAGVPSTIGFGAAGSIASTWTQIPGKWKNIERLGPGICIALSASGDVFWSSWSFSLLPNFTNRYDLSANKLPIGKYVDIQGNTTNSIYAMSATRNDDIALTSVYYNHTTDNWSSIIGSHVFSNNVKLIGTQCGGQIPMILSGSSLYVLPLSDRYVKNSTGFFKDITTYSSSYTKLTSININYIDGWINNSDTGITSESIVYLSAGKWYMGGFNESDVFASKSIGRDDIIVSGIGTTSNVSGYTTSKTTKFEDCIKIASKSKAFPVTQGGDSGSAVFALLSSTVPALSTWKCIGLVFAGPTPANNASGLVCRIDNIVNQLKIKPWNGTIPTTKSKIHNTTYFSPLTAISTITLSGREYYNIGII